jgi:hypothetical protein
VKVGTENRRNLIAAIVLGVIAVLVAVYQFMPASSTVASTTTAPGPGTSGFHPLKIEERILARKGKAAKGDPGKKEKPAQSLDPTLNLRQLSATEQIKYEGSGRNIFVSQAEVEIPKPLAPGQTGPAGAAAATPVWQLPAATAPPPIPLKFFGFANHPGEPKKVFLSKGDDVFIAGEGEIVDRRYKVVHISTGSVEIQDVVTSGPPQTVPLTQG